MNCPLCNRKDMQMSSHHLIPKAKGGAKQATVLICEDCHGTIHAFFDNQTLERDLNSVEALLSNEQFTKHLRWLAKRPDGARYKTKTPKGRRGRRG